MRARSSADLLLLLAAAAATAWAARRAAAVPVDLESRAMRSHEGAAAHAQDERERLFGPDATVVLLLAPRRDPAGGEPAGGAEDAGEEEALERWSSALEALPEVAETLSLPVDSEEERLVALTLLRGPDGDTADALAAVSEAARHAAPATHEVAISGSPAADMAIAAALAAEQRRIVPLVALTLFALLFAVYRSAALALGTMLPALAGIAWVGALQGALGFSNDPVTSLLPPVLLAVGVASAIHLVDAYLEERRAGLAPGPATRAGAGLVLVPALGCAATTAIGFLALVSSPIPAIERFGLLAAAGVAATFALAFLALPPWLRLFARSERLLRRSAGHGPWRPLSAVLARALARGAPGIAALAAAGALALGFAWTRLAVDTDPLRILPEHHPFRVDTARIGARLGGTELFDLLLPAPGPGGGVLALLGLQGRVLALDGVAGPGGPPRRAEDGTGLVSFLLAPAGSTAREATFAAAEALARERGWEGARATGLAVRQARDSGAIVRGEVRGLLFTFLALVPCMLVVLRSARLALAGLAANTLPCLLLHGGLALAGRPLSVASAMIGSVVLGLVVDNALYFLHGYRGARREAHRRLAVARTLQRTGRALSIACLVLALSFLAGLAGELTTTREFGVLASGSILAAWGANVLVLPALLLCRRDRRTRG